MTQTQTGNTPNLTPTPTERHAMTTTTLATNRTPIANRTGVNSSLFRAGLPTLGKARTLTDYRAGLNRKQRDALTTLRRQVDAIATDTLATLDALGE